MACACQVASNRDGGPTTANDGLVDLVEIAVQIVHLGTGANRNGGAGNIGSAVLRTKRIMFLPGSKVVRPDGKRVGSIGTADIVVTGALDD
jgi:hypothetical protein